MKNLVLDGVEIVDVVRTTEAGGWRTRAVLVCTETGYRLACDWYGARGEVSGVRYDGAYPPPTVDTATLAWARAAEAADWAKPVGAPKRTINAMVGAVTPLLGRGLKGEEMAAMLGVDDLRVFKALDRLAKQGMAAQNPAGEWIKADPAWPARRSA